MGASRAVARPNVPAVPAAAPAPAPVPAAAPAPAATGASSTASARRRSGALLSYAYTFVQVAVNLLYVPLLLSGIGADEYGLYQMVGSIMAHLAVMNTTFSAGTTRYYCKYHAEGNVRMMENTLATCARIYRVVSVVAIAAGAAAIAVFRGVYAGSLSNAQLAEGSLMLAVLVANLIVTMNNTINAAVINAHERFVFLKATQLLSVVAQPLVAVLLIRVWPCALAISCVQLACNALCALAQRLFARRTLGARVVLHDKDRALLKGLLVFSTAILTVTIADQVFWETNQLVLGYLSGTAVVAVYSVGYQVAQIYLSVGIAIPAVFLPRVTELNDRGDLRALSDLFVKCGRLSLYPLMLILTFFFAFGEDFVRLWAGEGFTDAWVVALLLMVPLTVDVSQHLGLIILQVMDKYYFRGWIYLAIALLNVVTVLMVAPAFGAVGAAACTGAAMLLGNGLVMNLYYARVIGLDIGRFWREVARECVPLLVLGAGATVVVRLTVAGCLAWPSLLAGLVVYAALFCLVAWVFSCNAYERALARELVGKACGVLRRAGRR